MKRIDPEERVADWFKAASLGECTAMMKRARDIIDLRFPVLTPSVASKPKRGRPRKQPQVAAEGAYTEV